jgi:hypothetical protein
MCRVTAHGLVLTQLGRFRHALLVIGAIRGIDMARSADHHISSSTAPNAREV